jgi:CheY-like chemotaxis protein
MAKLDARGRPLTILIADDDEEDREMARETLPDSQLADNMRFVCDGQELLDYLRSEGAYADPSVPAPRPGIILLDLNMPRMDGREALVEIRADEALRRIPVVVLTTSKDEQDIQRSYELGANSFITKPMTLAGLADAMRTLATYWFELVELPNGAHRDDYRQHG